MRTQLQVDQVRHHSHRLELQPMPPWSFSFHLRVRAMQDQGVSWMRNQVISESAHERMQRLYILAFTCAVLTIIHSYFEKLMLTRWVADGTH
jgi:hypothetical protein